MERTTATLQAVFATRATLDLVVISSARCTGSAWTTLASVTNSRDTKVPYVKSQAVQGGLRTAVTMAPATKLT